MATPTVSASLDRAVYAPGAVMTLTVRYGDTDNQVFTVEVVVTDADGNRSAPATVTATIADPLAVSVTDSEARAWTRISDTGSVAVYTARA